MKRQFHFADIAVQVHSGDPIDENHIGWHSDAPNSTLHLALSIRGKRCLHSRLAKGIADEAMALEKHPQESGCVYVSSPFAFPHGVQYSEAQSWEDRIVAVQIRFLLTQDDYARMRETYDSLESCMDNITRALHNQHGKLMLPTLQEVQAAARGMPDAVAVAPRAGPVKNVGKGLYDNDAKGSDTKTAAPNSDGKPAVDSDLSAEDLAKKLEKFKLGSVPTAAADNRGDSPDNVESAPTTAPDNNS